jgi:hypothetical protein
LQPVAAWPYERPVTATAALDGAVSVSGALTVSAAELALKGSVVVVAAGVATLPVSEAVMLTLVAAG